ncbi:Serine/threonine protein phosphatase [Handroanthus impetiginosus]|uniref:Protein phosphatase n=1 Tax=Handroanthus impetiginosus TaxID=429701 RepID=A0A2G9G985_9LAMI|nr:Serine/threonine protein phosphatase [Handroanthus impetiginosus]
MPYGLLSNMNVAFKFSFPRAVTVKQSQPLHLIETLFSRKIMAASGSIVASGDLMVDTLASGCGNLSGFVKPGGVFFGDRSKRICRKARVSMRSGDTGGCLVFDFGRQCNNFGRPFSGGINKGRSFSSSCYPDGVVPEVSTDGSLSVEPLSSLALSPEQTSPSRSILKLLSGACYLPHPAKEETGGEDAHFICANEQVIGVADGVGGWSEVGVNAGLYARELMSNSVKAIRNMRNGDIIPLRVLEKAHAATKAQGSSTACIIALKDKDLHAINLGDSGFIVIREGSTIFESPAQQYSFNYTYQLECGTRANRPGDGQVFKISVLPGDVIVAGTDGLFDNLYNKEIADIVANATKVGLSPDTTAQRIASFARLRATDGECRTPFSTAAQKAGIPYYGGKLDDLTVVVSYVSTPPNV